MKTLVTDREYKKTDFSFGEIKPALLVLAGSLTFFGVSIFGFNTLYRAGDKYENCTFVADRDGKVAHILEDNKAEKDSEKEKICLLEKELQTQKMLIANLQGQYRQIAHSKSHPSISNSHLQDRSIDNLTDDYTLEHAEQIIGRGDLLKGYTILARTYSLEGMDALALDFYNKAILLDAYAPHLYSARSFVHKALGHLEDAIRDEQKMEELLSQK